MRQLDKAVVLVPKDEIASGKICGLDADPSVSKITFHTSEHSGDGTIRQIVIQTIPLDKALSSKTSAQTYLRRSSVAAVLIPSSSDSDFTNNTIKTVIGVCRGYNSSAPCIGPNVEILLIVYNTQQNRILTIANRARRFARNFSLKIKIAILGDDQLFGTRYACDEISVQQYPLNTSLGALIDHEFCTDELHWDSIPLLNKESADLIQVAASAVSDILKSGRAIVSRDAFVAEFTSKDVARMRCISQLQIEYIIDLLDKSGEIRSYPLTRHVFVDVLNYRHVVDHVLEKVRALDDSRDGIAVIDIEEIAKGSSYLQRLSSNEKYDVIRSLTEELVHSGVVSRCHGEAREYVVRIPDSSMKILSALSVPTLRKIPAAIAVAIKERGYELKGRYFAATGKSNNGVAFIPGPVSPHGRVSITGLYITNGGENITSYLDAVENPSRNRNVIADLWSERAGSFSTGYDVSASWSKWKFIKNEMSELRTAWERAVHAEAPSIRLDFNWLFIDDILKPTKDTFREKVRYHAMKLASKRWRLTLSADEEGCPDIIRNATDIIAAWQREGKEARHIHTI